jgi:hypothetical protein
MFSVYCLLLLPSASIAIMAARRRTDDWMLMLVFSLTSVVMAAAESFFSVFVLKQFDPKFRYSPQSALELDLLCDAMMTFVGVCVFSASLPVLARRTLRPRSLGVWLAAGLGGTYVTVPPVSYALAGNTPTALFWVWVILFPIISARMTLRTIRSPKCGSLAVRDRV